MSNSRPSEALAISPEVRQALARGTPVVALESSLVTHGLPRPRNVEVALAAEAGVRAGGAVPATVAVRDGCLAVGLTEAEIHELGGAAAGKASRHNLAEALGAGGWWGTTVSATMIAADRAGIAVFATGGIGGVHRGADRSFDISADLDELARTPVAVVCSGPKAILDVPATLEILETRGVPVIAVGMAEVPGFWCTSSGLRAPIPVPDEPAAADVVARHWELGLDSGVLVCVAVPAADAIESAESEAAISSALAEAVGSGIRGAETTPWLLARIAELTDGRSLDANAALIVNNAHAAARLAAELTRSPHVAQASRP